jgi:hypothetical protein
MGAHDLATILEPGGPLLSEGQCMVLLVGAAAEGLCGGIASPSPDVLGAKAFRREWGDLLASIALFGPARAVLPAHLAASVDIAPLLELGLAEIITVDRTQYLRHQIAATYEHAFNAYRELEQHPATTPLRSLTELPPGPEERLDARMLIGDAEFYLQRLDAIVTPFTAGLRDIFGYYTEANYDLTRDAINGYVAETFSPDAATARDLERRTPDLYASMGLYLRERELLEEESGLSIPGISYSPACLSDFAALDRDITTPPGDFMSFTRLGLVLNQFDWEDFISVHAYWRSFFELTNMLEISELTENPLFLPSGASVRPAPATEPPSLHSTGDAVRIYQLLLAETRRMPTPTTLRETETLRRDPNLHSLRTVLNHWTAVARGADDDDARLLQTIRADIDLAAKRLKRAQLLGGVGKLVGLVSLPATVVDVMRGSAWGAGLAPIGPAIDRYGARQLKKAGWIRLGRP